MLERHFFLPPEEERKKQIRKTIRQNENFQNAENEMRKDGYTDCEFAGNITNPKSLFLDNPTLTCYANPSWFKKTDKEKADYRQFSQPSLPCFFGRENGTIKTRSNGQMEEKKVDIIPSERDPKYLRPGVT